MNLFTEYSEQYNAFNYDWKLTNGFPQSKDNIVKPNNYKTFSFFGGGGGSGLGYKLAGFSHLGCVEINSKIAEVYANNLKSKYIFAEDIRTFNKKDDIPEELYNLDILDGSPPCTTFSVQGEKQKAFGKLKKFAEGSHLQTLDDLVFEYCKSILKLKPKVFLFENVKGFNYYYSKNHKRQVKDMLQGEYSLNEYILNGADMGLPQKRERYFLIGINKKYDDNFFFLSLNFNEKHITYKDIADHADKEKGKITDNVYRQWLKAKQGESLGKFRSIIKLKDNEPVSTIRNKKNVLFSSYYPRAINKAEMLKASSFPSDYNFKTEDNFYYILGMCVPPLMIANIALQIKNQILDKIYERI